MKQLTPLLLTIILFSCNSNEEKKTGLKAQLKDTAFLKIDIENWAAPPNGEYLTLTVRRVMDSGVVYSKVDSIVEGGVTKYSQEVKRGIDTAYYYVQNGWLGDTSQILYPDSASVGSRARRHSRLVRIPKDPAIKVIEASPIYAILPYNPFKPLLDTTKAKPKVDSPTIKK